MATPTQRLTRRTAAVLTEDVALAVRVRKGPAQRPKPGPTAGEDGAAAASPPSLPILGLPVIPYARSVARAIGDLFAGDEVRNGVLAFTRSGGLVFLGRARLRPLRPTETIRRLSADPPVTIDLALLYEDLVPQLEIGAEHYIVNAIDFGVLTRALAAGELDAPALAAQLTPYYEQVKALATHDPRTVRSLLAADAAATRTDR